MYWCSRLMDFKGHNINIFRILRHKSFWRCFVVCPINNGYIWDTFGTRLETRTKESIQYASKWEYCKPICVNNLTVLMGLRVFFQKAPPSRGIFIIYSVLLYSLQKIYHEHTGYDPKDGELCLIRLKSGETLMEDRSNSDVQIDCQNWAQGRKTNRTIQQLVPSEVSLRIAGAYIIYGLTHTW